MSKKVGMDCSNDEEWIFQTRFKDVSLENTDDSKAVFSRIAGAFTEKKGCMLALVHK